MARNFNGSTDRISVGASTDLAYTTSFSFAAWVFPTTVSQLNAIVSHQTGSYYLRINSSNHLEFLRSNQASIVTGSATFAANVWRHVGFVVDGSGNVQMYVDGAADGSNTAAGLASPTKALLIGSDEPAPSSPWPGNIAEAAIWNAVLTANEMKALALGRLPFGVRPASLQFYLPLYGLQSPEPDLSGNALNGTLTGTAQANHAPVTLFTAKQELGVPVAGAAPSIAPLHAQSPYQESVPYQLLGQAPLTRQLFVPALSPLPPRTPYQESLELRFLLEGQPLIYVSRTPVPLVKPPVPATIKSGDDWLFQMLMQGQVSLTIAGAPSIPPPMPQALYQETVPYHLFRQDPVTRGPLPPVPIVPWGRPVIAEQRDMPIPRFLMEGSMTATANLVLATAPVPPPPPTRIITLAVVNNGDGTATATVKGSSSQATNKIFTQIADSTVRTPNFILQATLTGDGSITFNLAPGIYWGMLQSTGPGNQAVQAPLVCFGVTSGITDVEDQCFQGVLSHLRGINFLGTASSPAGVDPLNGIEDGLVPIDQFLTFPTIMVTLEGEAESISGMTNLRDDFGFPVRVTIIDQNDMVSLADQAKRRPKYTKWREQIARAFERQRLGGVPDIFDCQVLPGPIVDQRLTEKRYVISGVTLRFFDRLSRGLT